MNMDTAPRLTILVVPKSIITWRCDSRKGQKLGKVMNSCTPGKSIHYFSINMYKSCWTKQISEIPSATNCFEVAHRHLPPFLCHIPEPHSSKAAVEFGLRSQACRPAVSHRFSQGWQLLPKPLTMTREPLDTDSLRGSRLSVFSECPAPVSSKRTWYWNCGHWIINIQHSLTRLPSIPSGTHGTSSYCNSYEQLPKNMDFHGIFPKKNHSTSIVCWSYSPPDLTPLVAISAIPVLDTGRIRRIYCSVIVKSVCWEEMNEMMIMMCNIKKKKQKFIQQSLLDANCEKKSVLQIWWNDNRQDTTMVPHWPLICHCCCKLCSLTRAPGWIFLEDSVQLCLDTKKKHDLQKIKHAAWGV